MKKISNKIIIGGILFLSCFLPYYSLLRGMSLIYLPSPISQIINPIRDLVIIFLFIISFNKPKNSYLRQNKINFAINILLIFLFFTFLITFVRGYPKIAIQAAHLTIIPILIFFSAKRAENKNPLFFKKFINLFLIIGLSVGLFSIYFYFFRPQLYFNLFDVLYSVGGKTTTEIASSYTRMMGPFFSPNVFGNYMATISIISFVKIVENKKVKLNWLIFFIATFNVILSFSRGSWLFELAGLMVVIFFLKGSIATFLKISFIWVLTVLLGISSLTYSSDINLYDVLNNRIFSVTSKEGNVYDRFDKLDEVIRSADKNPFGAGLGAGSQASAGEVKYVSEVGVNVIDSYYLKALTEGGILGLSLFLFAMGYIIVALVRKINKKDKNIFNLSTNREREFILISLAITIGTMLQSIGSNPLDYVATAPFIWVFLGISSELRKT